MNFFKKRLVFNQNSKVIGMTLVPWGTPYYHEDSQLALYMLQSLIKILSDIIHANCIY